MQALPEVLNLVEGQIIAMESEVEDIERGTEKSPNLASTPTDANAILKRMAAYLSSVPTDLLPLASQPATSTRIPAGKALLQMSELKSRLQEISKSMREVKGKPVTNGDLSVGLVRKPAYLRDLVERAPLLSMYEPSKSDP